MRLRSLSSRTGSWVWSRSSPGRRRRFGLDDDDDEEEEEEED